jgi:hypothetical protein
MQLFLTSRFVGRFGLRGAPMTPALSRRELIERARAGLAHGAGAREVAGPGERLAEPEVRAGVGHRVAQGAADARRVPQGRHRLRRLVGEEQHVPLVGVGHGERPERRQRPVLRQRRERDLRVGGGAGGLRAGVQPPVRQAAAARRARRPVGDEGGAAARELGARELPGAAQHPEEPRGRVVGDRPVVEARLLEPRCALRRVGLGERRRRAGAAGLLHGGERAVERRDVPGRDRVGRDRGLELLRARLGGREVARREREAEPVLPLGRGPRLIREARPALDEHGLDRGERPALGGARVGEVHVGLVEPAAGDGRARLGLDARAVALLLEEHPPGADRVARVRGEPSRRSKAARASSKRSGPRAADYGRPIP